MSLARCMCPDGVGALLLRISVMSLVFKWNKSQTKAAHKGVSRCMAVLGWISSMSSLLIAILQPKSHVVGLNL